MELFSDRLAAIYLSCKTDSKWFVVFLRRFLCKRCFRQCITKEYAWAL